MQVPQHSIYRIDKATVNDCKQIRELASQVWEPTYGDILTSEQLEYMFEWMYSEESLERQMQSGHVFYIVYEHQAAIGYLSVEKENDNRYHLQKIYVLPSCQGKGLGRLMLNKAEEHVREGQSAGPLALVLNVNRQNKAKGFYEKLGFRVESEGDFDIGNGFFMNDYIMVKDIL